MTAFVARAAREHDYACIVAPECDSLLLRLHDAVGAARWLGCAKEAIARRIEQERDRRVPRRPRHFARDDRRPMRRATHRPGRDAGSSSPDDGAGGLDTYVYDDFRPTPAPNTTARAAAGAIRCCRNGWTASRSAFR